MQYRRLIPVLFIMNGLIVRSEDFSTHQIIGNIINEAARYNQWNVDELIYVDISRDKTYDSRRDDHKIKAVDSIETIITEISKVCFMPLTFGGGIKTIEDVDLRIRTGADKVVINSAAYHTPELITEVARKYGSQCCVISADYRMVDGTPILFTDFGSNNTGINVVDWVKECQKNGAGEIFLHAIDRDGKACGYDFDTISDVTSATSLPVIACGGAADVDDFIDVYEETNVAAVAAGNMFHFTERAYPRAKKDLVREKIHVRP
ncbi:imidazole glycerol phosphate synthase cyclase subunit [Pseudodesulfovibrio sp. zrk46]|uniref:imidazole glycerol phosphate synthase subunit HisF n=1 Tax=Pseudodesulfovibrio sp. zrk46 TaxID=2725288 RepID=UPI00144985D8|nr:imidazole glycerol phosphate synthase cyclase subunit [Pseudodesulfovibrio sp. zrk46]QJB58058.1 imidazole glycerol phosphate synthase subunit HisF [Pseudodesulfovibrio sp. zrk46]